MLISFPETLILHPILVTCSQDCCPNTSFILFRNTLGNHKLTFYGILAGTTLFYSACYYTIGSLHCFIFKNCLGEQQNNFNLEGVIYLYQTGIIVNLMNHTGIIVNLMNHIEISPTVNVMNIAWYSAKKSCKYSVKLKYL